MASIWAWWSLSMFVLLVEASKTAFEPCIIPQLNFSHSWRARLYSLFQSEAEDCLVSLWQAIEHDGASVCSYCWSKLLKRLIVPVLYYNWSEPRKQSIFPSSKPPNEVERYGAHSILCQTPGSDLQSENATYCVEKGGAPPSDFPWEAQELIWNFITTRCDCWGLQL